MILETHNSHTPDTPDPAPTTRPKAWRDIWGSDQGIGAVQGVAHTRTVIDRMKREYDEARRLLCARPGAAG